MSDEEEKLILGELLDHLEDQCEDLTAQVTALKDKALNLGKKHVVRIRLLKAEIKLLTRDIEDLAK